MCVMKAALNMVVAKFAAELKSQDIEVLTLSPGVVAIVESPHIFWQLTYGGTTYPTYTYVRKNNNYNSPVTDLTSNDLRCNAGAGAGDATDTLAVKAGNSFTFTSDVAVYHNGATAMYMAKAPTTAKEYDGSGQRWFKILEIGPVWKGSGDPTWPLYQTYTYRIPPATPNGEYLLRIEQLALHNPGGVPQFYIGCAQISVTGGGNGNPGPLVAIPGYVKGTESGYTVNIYNNFKSYTLVGPAVWAGQNDTSPVQVPSTPTIAPTTLKPIPTPTPTPSPSFVLTPIVVPTTSSTLAPAITTPPPLAPVTVTSTVYATKWNTSFVFFTATTTATIVSPSVLTTTLTSSCLAVATITQNLGGVTITTTAPALPGLTTTIISTTTAPALTIISTAPPTTTTATATLTITAPDAAKTVTLTITTLSLYTVTTYDTITSYSTLTETATVTVGSGGSNNVPPANEGGGTIALWSKCGGKDWTGSGTCVAGSTCKFSNDYYSQCVTA
ncbi:hypothetical protein IFR05_011301 [Cadophora sp. M221]|nr:hypothetical protein IFR05_011301 [Cadophora sp. M221]